MLLATPFFLLLGLAQGAPSPAGGGTSSTPVPSTLGFVWRGETGRTPDDVRREGGIWARGFQLGGLTAEQLEAGSSLYAHVNGGTREHTQYVSTTSSLQAAINFAVRPSPEHAHEPGFLYRIRTNWAMVDVNLSLENIAPFPWQHEHAVVQGIPWNQIMGWYRITTADVNRILSADDPVSEMGPFTRNPDFHPDATYPSGAQPQLAGLQLPVEGRHGAWEAFVGQSATEHLRAFISNHHPQADTTTLRTIDWSPIRIPDHLRATIAQGTASSAQCALAAAAIIVSFRRHDELKRSIPGGQLTAREETGNPGYDSCARLAAVAKAKIDDEKPTVKICDSPSSGGQCTDLEAPAEKCVPLPFEWNDKASTVRPSVAAGVCKFFRDYGCVADAFEVAYPGNDNLGEFSDGHFNDMISSFRCEGAGAGEETQIERPPTESREISGVHVCESDRFSPSCRRFPVSNGDCANLPEPWDSKATSIRPEKDAGACKFYRQHGCNGDDFETSFPGVDLFSDKKLESFNDQVKSFRCDSSGKKPENECEQGREPVKCTPSLQSPVAPPDEGLYIRGCCAKSVQTEEECCRSQLQWLDIRTQSQPYIAPDSWYKGCAIGKLMVNVQLANIDWAGTDDRLFLEIGHSSKWDGGQPHYLLKASPDKGDKMTKEINLEDAFDKSPVTPGDIDYVRLADRVDNGGVGTDELKLQGM
ncbi:Heat-labile enterotoxin IIA, A chain, partial [Metarhizium brunneum ARSEF 3297]